MTSKRKEKIVEGILKKTVLEPLTKTFKGKKKRIQTRLMKDIRVIEHGDRDGSFLYLNKTY
jgi:hypothetical protein